MFHKFLHQVASTVCVETSKKVQLDRLIIPPRYIASKMLNHETCKIIKQLSKSKNNNNNTAALNMTIN